jgi:hypothetical protein
MNKQVENRMFQQDFREAMDCYINGLSECDKYDMIYHFWFDWLVQHVDVAFVEKFIKTKEL